MKYMVVLSCVIILLFVNDIVVCVVCGNIRERRQAAPAQESEYSSDYAGKENDKKNEDTDANLKGPDAGAVNNVDDAPADYANDFQNTPKDNLDNAPKDPPQDNNADLGGDDFTAPAPDPPPKETRNSEERSAHDSSAELKKIKKAKKRSKFVKDVIKYLKKVLTPQNLMQNQWVTEMLRKFSNSADDDYKSVESVEEKTLEPVKRKRGRPKGRKSRKKLPKGLKGLIAYGLRTVTEIDRRKLRRNLRYVRRIARKAKKPLKAAVRLLLSSRTNTGGLGDGGGGGGGGYGNNY